MIRTLPIAVSILLAGCGGGAEPAANTEASTESAADDAPTAEVRVAVAMLGAISDSVTAYGATEAGPGNDRSVVAPAEAIVAQILAPTGTAVGAGQAIVTLLPSRTSRLEAVKAVSDARVADAALARAVRLRRDGLVSDADVETARAASATAHATVASVGVPGGGLTLRAPTGGTVENLTARPGDQIAAGATVATVAGRGDVRARFGVDPAIAPRIRVGRTAQVQLLDGSAAVLAPIVGVDPTVDATTRLASVFVKIPGGVSRSPGEPLRATVRVGAIASGITIPYAALLDDGGRSFVFVIKKGVAKSVDVSPGSSSGDRIQILRGLQPGDRVVVEGGTALEDDMKVRIVGSAANAGAGK